MNEKKFPERATPPEVFEAPDPEPTGASVAQALRLAAQVDAVVLDEGLVQEAPMGQTIIYNKDSMGETLLPEAQTDSGAVAPLLSREEAEYLRSRWDVLQGRFADEPRLAVEQADLLVGEVIEKITQVVAGEQRALARDWKGAPDLSTEDLRQALQHYRVFFNRLLMQFPV
jgi:hypothetical protein